MMRASGSELSVQQIFPELISSEDIEFSERNNFVHSYSFCLVIHVIKFVVFSFKFSSVLFHVNACNEMTFVGKSHKIKQINKLLIYVSSSLFLYIVFYIPS